MPLSVQPFRQFRDLVARGAAHGRAWLRQKRQPVIAVTASVALLAGSTVTAVLLTQHLAECSDKTRETALEARMAARTCGTDIEIVGQRTPWQTYYASPNGENSLEMSAAPVRVPDGRGGWTDPDNRFVQGASGGPISIAAPVFPMTFSAGLAGNRGAAVAGVQPLARIENRDMALEAWFPLPLPPATVTDDRIVYEFGDGITLHLSVDGDGTGFLPVVELANPAAAAAFEERLQAVRDEDSVDEGSEIAFELGLSSGLQVTETDEHVIEIADQNGEVHFEVAPPSMWDSAGADVSASVTEASTVDRTALPAAGDHISALEIDVAGSSIIVSPDDAMLANSETVWPVYIDPTLSGKGSAERIAVRTGGYNNTLHNWTNVSSSSLGQGTGYCTATASCNVVFKQRLMWEFGSLGTIANLASTDIVSATFRVNGTHSANCTAQPTYLRKTSTISSGSTWSSVSIGTTYGSRTEAHSASCGNRGYKNFTFTAGAQWIASANSSVISVGLLVSEANMTGWKRFAYDTTLTIKWNQPPRTPSDLKLDAPDSPICATGTARPVIANLTPTLTAWVGDPDKDNVSTQFTVIEVGVPTPVVWQSPWGTPQALDSTAKATVIAGKLQDGHNYAWKAQSRDTSAELVKTSPESGWCEFQVDISAPEGPAITPVADDPDVEAVYLRDRESGGVHQLGKFVIDRGTQTDVTKFRYSIGGAAPVTENVGIDGKLTIPYDPGVTGTVTLKATSLDAASNPSLETVYVFRVGSPVEDAAWTLDEGTGPVAEDSFEDGARPLAVAGATWIDGPHELFDSRDGDFALLFDGVDDQATADGSVVDTEGSFAISVFLKLDSAAVAGSNSYTAVSQDGTVQSGFTIGYSGSCAAGAGCWTFSMPQTRDGASVAVVQNANNVAAGEWVHLLAEHNAGNHEMTLWTCSIGTPGDAASADPVPSTASGPGSTWPASGAFALGRAQSDSAGSEFWPGAIDNVRAFSDEVVSTDKIRRLCQGAEATDFGGDDDAPIDPTKDEE